MKRAALVLCLLVGVACLAGCTPPQEFEANPAALETFESASSLVGYFGENSSGTAVPGPLDWLLGDRNSPGTIPTYWPGSVMWYDPTYGTAAGLDGTRLQDIWANEMDSARMQGDYMYVLDDYGLGVVKAVPANDMKVLGRFNMFDPWPVSLQLLPDNKAVVVSTETYSYSETGDPGQEPAWLPDTEYYYDVWVLDLADPADPIPLARYSIQGTALATRVVDGNKLVTVSVTYPDQSFFTGVPASDMSIESILPKYRLIGSDNKESIEPLVTYDHVFRPANPDGNAIITLATIDLTQPGSVPVSAGFLGYWEVALQTPTSFYFSNTPYKPGSGYAYRTTTEIHRFDITGDTPCYAGSVKLEGRTDPYGSFYEKDGYLRVLAAKVGNISDLLVGDYVFSDYIYYAVEPTSKGMKVAAQSEFDVGSFTPWGFMWTGNYFVLSGTRPDRDDCISLLVDTADPLQPVLLGEAGWPADWAYLYMLDDTHLMAMGWQWTLPDDPDDYHASYQMHMYDTTQLLQPTLVHNVTVGEGSTHANGWFGPEMILGDGLLVVPVALYEGRIPDDLGLQTFGGIYAYHVSAANGFEYIGRVETASAYAYTYWQRPILKDGILYAVTNAGVKAVAIGDMNTVLSSVRLP